MITVDFCWRPQDPKVLEPTVEYSFEAPDDVAIEELTEQFHNWLRAVGYLVD
jgi:hypothetical protein